MIRVPGCDRKGGNLASSFAGAGAIWHLSRDSDVITDTAGAKVELLDSGQAETNIRVTQQLFPQK